MSALKITYINPSYPPEFFPQNALHEEEDKALFEVRVTDNVICNLIFPKRLEKPLQRALIIPERTEYFNALTNISVQLVNAEYYQEAHIIALCILQGKNRATVLKEIMLAYIKNNEFDHLKETLQGLQRNQGENDEDILFLMENLIHSNQPERAEIFIQHIVSERKKDVGLGLIAVALANKGDIAPAFEFQKQIQNEHESVLVDLYLARALAKEGRFVEAVSLCEKTLTHENTSDLERTKETIKTFCEIAHEFIEKGAIDEAIALAQGQLSSMNASITCRIFTTIAKELIQRNQLERLQEILNYLDQTPIGSYAEKSSCIVRIAKAFAKVKLLDSAFHLKTQMQMIPVEDSKKVRYITIQLFRAGKKMEGIAFATSLYSLVDGISFRANLVKNLVQEGYLDEARTILQILPICACERHSLVKIVRAFAQAKEFSYAIGVAERIENISHFDKEEAFSIITEELVKARFFERAFSTVQKISNDYPGKGKIYSLLIKAIYRANAETTKHFIKHVCESHNLQPENIAEVYITLATEVAKAEGVEKGIAILTSEEYNFNSSYALQRIAEGLIETGNYKDPLKMTKDMTFRHSSYILGQIATRMMTQSLNS